jgi:glutathione S-transferase
MAEDHLYWTLLDARWLDDANFAKGPAKFFERIPAPLRAVIAAMVRRSVRKRTKAHGMGNHTQSEIVALGTRSIDSIADYLGANSFFMGHEPTGVDATMFAFVAGALCPHFETPLRTAAERHDNLRRYVGRIAARFYPNQSEIAGCKAAA